MTLKLEEVSDGYRVVEPTSGNLLAHVQARWPNSDHADHIVTWDPLPRADWIVRLNGAESIGNLEAILALLPKE